jgi:ABC-type sugar transport system ATPase subunit
MRGELKRCEAIGRDDDYVTHDQAEAMAMADAGNNSVRL